jgi:hypothetical protein
VLAHDGPPDHKEAVLLMADENPTRCTLSNRFDGIPRDERDQAVVLGFVLDQHPIHLTIPELCRALYAHPGDFKANDAVERAIRDLDGAGLLSCRGGIVAPTWAALNFERLEMD